jgi:hypothetical protein
MKKLLQNKKTLWGIAAALGAMVIIAGAIFMQRPRQTWYVEASLANTWARVLRKSAAPFTRIRVYKESEGLPKNAVGYIVSREGLEAGDGVTLYPELSDVRQYQDSMVLALDPWMVFYKHTGAGLSRNRADSPGEGSLILPGKEAGALQAWTSQFLQEKPGVFPTETELWNMEEETLPLDHRFQQNAADYNWSEALSLLLKEDSAWLYAPLSRVRELPSYRMGLLKAAHFPVRPDWNEFGLQADLLWARPIAAKETQAKKMAAADSWLRNPETQTLIADELHWIPAHPEGKPYNPLSRDAQLAWLSSSYIWQTKGNEAEGS